MQVDSYLSALAMDGQVTIRALPKRLTQHQSWQSSIQIDYAFERAHAKTTHNYSTELVRGSSCQDALTRLAGLRP